MEAITQVINGQDIQDRDVAYSLVKSLLKGDALQVFKNAEASQEIKDGPAFMKCLAAVTKNVFPKKTYETQKMYFPMPDGVTATKIACKEFVDVLEDGVLYQWKLEFEKEGFDLSSSKLKEFLGVCVCLEEAELQKLLKKKIACAIKEHDDLDRKKKHQEKPKSRHEKSHGLGKRHQSKCKKKFCDYHGFCYHDMDECNFIQACRKHVWPMHHITEQQRLWQVWFEKDDERQSKRRGLSGKEVKDLNMFVKDKINETIKERNHNMHTMSDFKDLSISSSDESIQSIISNTSDEDLDYDSCKLAHKK
eukprot:10068369-Ditylum_brightwellii.AAC.1